VITAKAMQQCLMFIYTGTVEREYLQLEVNGQMLYREMTFSSLNFHGIFISYY
jgi:hypothetical protein